MPSAPCHLEEAIPTAALEDCLSETSNADANWNTCHAVLRRSNTPNPLLYKISNDCQVLDCLHVSLHNQLFFVVGYLQKYRGRECSERAEQEATNQDRQISPNEIRINC